MLVSLAVKLVVPTLAHVAGRLDAIVRPVVGRLFRNRPGRTATVTLTLGAALWTGGLYAAWFTADVMFGLPDRQAIRNIGDLAQATTLYDIHDKVVFTIFREQRIEVPLARVSPNLIKAVIAIEDQRFYDHRGIDVVRVGAAVLANVRSGRRAQGGSTITQQLARQSFLTRDKTINRKLKEIVLAAQIEQSYSKAEILETYLNKVYFGEGFHGVEAAALGYFSKPSSELTVAEAALLAGLIQSPSGYAPTANAARALSRRNVVLGAMRDSGVIDEQAWQAARATPLALKNGLHRDEPFGLYFKELVRRELVDRFGWERVSEGGLKVYTTIDGDLQPRIETMVEEALTGIEARRGYKHPRRADLPAPAEDVAPAYLQAAAMVMDGESGEVRALVGGRDFKESRFNRAVQAKRQAGSAFKPFVYAAALEQGMSPASVITGLDDPVLTAEGAWAPEDEHSGAAEMTMRTALRTSSNRAAVQVLRTVGIGKAATYIRQFDVGDVPAVPSMALGAGDVTLAQMTGAYAAFARSGEMRKPVYIRRVVDREGQVLFRSENPRRRVLSPITAFLLSNMLADVINSGTGWKARAAGFTLPAAGKTGTTNDYRDVWFVGFTPRVVTGVWIGFDQPQPIIDNGYAGELAVPLWASIMKAATAGDKAVWLERPEGVVAVPVCRVSGKLPDEGCSSVEVMKDNGNLEYQSMVYTEYFARGTSPSDLCDLHPSRAWYQRVADVFTGSPAPHREADLPPPPTNAAAPQTGAAVVESPREAVTAPAAPVAEEEKPKKRGFWGRLFGRRDKDDADKRREKDPKASRDPKDKKDPPGPPQ